MNTYIKTKVVIVEAIKNKQMGYFTIVEKDQPNVLKIKAVSANGRGRGVVGIITKNGNMSFDDGKKEHEIRCLITPQIQKKINFVLRMMFSSNEISRGMMKRKRETVLC
jgi:hypothetical protein